MSLDVMHTYQRNIFCKTDRLCLRKSYEQGSNKTRSIGNTDRINLIK